MVHGEKQIATEQSVALTFYYIHKHAQTTNNISSTDDILIRKYCFNGMNAQSEKGGSYYEFRRNFINIKYIQQS